MTKTAEQIADELLAQAGITLEPKERGGRCKTEELGPDSNALVRELASLNSLAYQQRRVAAAAELGIGVGALDKLVRHSRAEAEEESAELPHWKVEPWPEPVAGAALLESIKQVFRRYIVLPKGADVALPLWVLHAWTMDAGDISPFMVLVSPTKRCGKTSLLIILLYLTPRSELASNISASAIFRHIEDSRPTLLIDEADSFVKDNQEMRGILNSGHTKAAAYVIRNIEINGEHKPRRFSTWAPKAIATIRLLADTLEDRSIIVTLQRKPRHAKVERLRRRDTEELRTLRSKAARWAADSFHKLADPDPQVPDALNDRATDNWRPLFAIADLAGGIWPEDARRAACTLSGEESDGSINVELLGDIRLVFGGEDAMRSVDLVAKLTADPERPWAEWKHGRPLSQKQLAGLLRPFGIVSETVSLPGYNDAKGYRRARFEEPWLAYCPVQMVLPPDFAISKRRNVGMPIESAQVSTFRSVAGASGDGSEIADMSYSHAGLDASTDRKAGNGSKGDSGRGGKGMGRIRSARRCDHCGCPSTAADPLRPWDWAGRPDGIWLHLRCEEPWLDNEGEPVTADKTISR